MYAESGLYTFTLVTPVKGAVAADRVRDRILTSLRGEPPRANLSNGTQGSLRKGATLLVGTFGFGLFLKYLTRAKRRGQRPS